MGFDKNKKNRSLFCNMTNFSFICGRGYILLHLLFFLGTCSTYLISAIVRLFNLIPYSQFKTLPFDLQFGKLCSNQNCLDWFSFFVRHNNDDSTFFTRVMRIGDTIDAALLLWLFASGNAWLVCEAFARRDRSGFYTNKSAARLRNVYPLCVCVFARSVKGEKKPSSNR